MTGQSVACAALGMPSDTPRTSGSMVLTHAWNRNAERTFVVETIKEYSVTKGVNGLPSHAPSARRSGAQTTLHQESEIADGVSCKKSPILTTSPFFRHASKQRKRVASISNCASAKHNLRATIMPRNLTKTVATWGSKFLISSAVNASPQVTSCSKSVLSTAQISATMIPRTREIR